MSSIDAMTDVTLPSPGESPVYSPAESAITSPMESRAESPVDEKKRIEFPSPTEMAEITRRAENLPAEEVVQKVEVKAEAKPASNAITTYFHVLATHSKTRTSCLSHDSMATPSFLGFRNLLVIVVVVMNLRLVVENFMKYGVLICIKCHEYKQNDLVLALYAYMLVLGHLFIAYGIELAAARHAKRIIGESKRSEDDQPPLTPTTEQQPRDSTWKVIAFLHTINATVCLAATSAIVYYYIFHPLVGTVCEIHAIIVWLKICSYAFTNRDLRHALLRPSFDTNLPELYRQCPYPSNITFGNLAYFWWAPTLVYQPVYPRSPRIRWSFVAKRVGEVAALSAFIWLASAQYAAPLLRNSIPKIASGDLAAIIERTMKLSTISLIIWLAGFFAVFQSALNALAEVLRFGDREFYTDWWNSASVGTYWRTWNKPVYSFMKRHIYVPLVGRGWSPYTASIMVFLFSGVMHELLVGIPTHNILGVAFVGMMIQIPLIACTVPLERMKGKNGKVIGNCIFWFSFCLVGQPLAALLYFFAWQAKYGSVARGTAGLPVTPVGAFQANASLTSLASLASFPSPTIAKVISATPMSNLSVSNFLPVPSPFYALDWTLNPTRPSYEGVCPWSAF